MPAKVQAASRASKEGTPEHRQAGFCARVHEAHHLYAGHTANDYLCKVVLQVHCCSGDSSQAHGGLTRLLDCDTYLKLARCSKGGALVNLSLEGIVDLVHRVPTDSRAPRPNIVDEPVTAKATGQQLSAEEALQRELSGGAHLLPSTSWTYGPLTWSNTIGLPPTDLKARTGLFTPPGSSDWASSKICTPSCLSQRHFRL